LALAADATTNQSMVHKVKNAPFNLMGPLSCDVHPMKKCPHALLCALASGKYDALEWMFMIMSDAWNRMVVSGFVAR
jgi:hypothetical protein